MNYDPRYQGYGTVPYGRAPINVWRCPFCSYQGNYIAATRVSTAGWVTFVVLLIFCFPLFWIGLLIRDTYTKCPQCLRG